MQFDGAKITEQGVTFAIAVVKSYVLTSPDREEIRQSFVPFFGNVPIVLMSKDSRGVPKFHGRTDIVKFLSKIHISQIPWKTYTLS